MSDRTHTHPASPEDITADSPLTLPGFFAALSDGRLLAGRCEECGERLLPPRPACYACGGRRVAVEEQPRTGEVVSYTEVRRPAPAFEHLAPFTVAVVELDSGARLTGRVDATFEETEIGMPVRLAVRDPADEGIEVDREPEVGWPIHVFEPA